MNIRIVPLPVSEPSLVRLLLFRSPCPQSHHQEQSLGGLNIVHQFKSNTQGAATAEGCEQTWSDMFRIMVLVLVARHAPEVGQFVQLLHGLCSVLMLVLLTTMQSH